MQYGDISGDVFRISLEYILHQFIKKILSLLVHMWLL